MQHIFHHNSSGNEAFTANLLAGEVLKATSLHPIKQHKYLYRMHNFINQRKIIDLRQRYLFLEKQVFDKRNQLLATARNMNAYEENFLNTSSNSILRERFLEKPTLKSAKPTRKRQDRYDFDFFTRSLFATTYVSPRRRLEGFWQSSITDSLRQVMEVINQNSKERGRLIDYKDTLYGYVRNHPLIGLDYIIDVLLIYRKYEGRKMTVPVRRHAYIRNSYVTMLFREDTLNTSIFVSVPDQYKPLNRSVNDLSNVNESSTHVAKKQSSSSFIKSIFSYLFNVQAIENTNNDIKVQDKPKHSDMVLSEMIEMKTINFVVPLAGRWDIFERFMLNYETICLKTNENVKLVIVLFENETTTPKQAERIKNLFKKLILQYNLSSANKQLNLIVTQG